MSSSQGMSSDIFGFLLMKNVETNGSALKFSKFIFIIFGFNILLILYNLSCTIYLKVNSAKTYNLLDTIDSFYRISSRLLKGSTIFFSYFIYENTTENNNNNYSYYLTSIGVENVIDYDYLIKLFIEYDSSLTLNDINTFNNFAFDYFCEDDYLHNIDYNAHFVHLEPSGNYTIKSEKIKTLLNYFTLTINQLSNILHKKLYINTKFLDFTYHNISSLTYPNLMTLTILSSETISKSEKNYFTELINIYQHLFNYFNSYVLNFNYIDDYLNTQSSKHINNLDNTNFVLLIIILVVNLFFVLVCLSSVIIYKKILKSEFENLYRLSEDNISKLQEKFQYVKEIIKYEQSPSKVYTKIRKLREEIEQAQLEDKIRQKKKENAELEKKGEVINDDELERLTKQQRNYTKKKKKIENNDKIKNHEDEMSMLTSGSMNNSSEYLQFSGAMKGLFRSSTLRAKEQLKRLNKETRKTKASQDLLKRLNFDFEMIKNFITIIIVIAITYILLGVLVLVLNTNNFHEVKTSLIFTNKLYNKFTNLFNFYVGVKLSIILNKKSPYSLYNSSFTPECFQCLYDNLEKYSYLTSYISNLEVNNKKFQNLYFSDYDMQSNNICTYFYENYSSTLNTYLNSTYISGLEKICERISILKSNIDSILNYIIITLRDIYDYYLTFDNNLNNRIMLLTKKFCEIDILMTGFLNFYFEYVFQTILDGLNKKTIVYYYNFLIVIFSANIIINILMIVFIWFKVYFQIIKSVENVQLITDSVSII